MVSDLGGSQISTLLETLPGIANVLRSPVANAIVGLIKAGARISDFNIADAEELVHYATRRSLLGTEEGEQLLAEVKLVQQKKQERAADRAAEREKAPPKPKPKPKPKPVTMAAAAPAAPKPAKAVKPVKAVKKPAAKKAKKK